jgi:hypothetical protein
MFELGILTAICFIAAVALITVSHRRQDVLYGPYIDDTAWSSAQQDDRIEGSSS